MYDWETQCLTLFCLERFLSWCQVANNTSAMHAASMILATATDLMADS